MTQHPIDVVQSVIRSDNEFQFNNRDISLLSVPNPRGEGDFVFSDRSRFYGVRRFYVWVVLDGEAFPLNGSSMDVSLNLRWPRMIEGWKERTGLSPFSPAQDADRILRSDVSLETAFQMMLSRWERRKREWRKRINDNR